MITVIISYAALTISFLVGFFLIYFSFAKKKERTKDVDTMIGENHWSSQNALKNIKIEQKNNGLKYTSVILSQEFIDPLYKNNHMKTISDGPKKIIETTEKNDHFI